MRIKYEFGWIGLKIFSPYDYDEIKYMNIFIIYYLLLTIFCALFGYLTWRDLRPGIYLICALLPSYLIRFQIGPVPMTLLEAMILILFIAWTIKNFQLKTFNPSLAPRSGAGLKLSTYHYPIIFLLIAATISIFISPDLRAAAGIWKAYFLEPILFFTVFITTVKTRKDLEKVFYALGVLVLGISIFAIWQKITGELIPVPMWRPAATRRVTTFFTSPNAIGLLVGPIIVLYFGWLVEKIKDLRLKIKVLKPYNFNLSTFNLKSSYYLLIVIFQLAVIILGLLSIVFARSRASGVAVIMAFIFILFFTWSKKWTAILAGLGIIIILLLPTSRSFVLSLATFKVPSGSTRLLLWEGTAKMLEDHPIFGAGLSGFWQVYQPYRLPKQTESLIYPHNIILNFWSEIGLLGLIAMIWIIVKYFKQGHRLVISPPRFAERGWGHSSSVISNKILIITLLAVMTEIIVHGFVDAPYFKNDLSVLFWLFIGMMVVLENLAKKEYNQ